MAKNRNALRAGIFMLVSIALAIAVIIGINGGIPFLHPPIIYLVGFSLTDNVAGLHNGDDVRLGGLKIGSVESIEARPIPIDGQTTDGILVAISVPPKYELHTDGIVAISTTVTGSAWLNISALGSKTELKPVTLADIAGREPAPDEVLHGTPDALTAFIAGLPDLETSASSTLAIYKGIGAQIHDAIPPLREKILTFIDKYTTLGQQAQDWLGPNTGNFKDSMVHIKSITAHFDDELPAFMASAQRFLNYSNNILARIQGEMDNLHETITRAKGIAVNVDEVIARNRGRIDEIVSGVNRASQNLATFGDQISDDPSKLIWPIPDPKNRNLDSAARNFAAGASALSDAVNALRDSLAEPQPDAAKVQMMYDNLSKQFDKFHQVQDELWKEIKE